MNFLSLLEGKREGKRLTPEQLETIVRGFTSGAIPDYQMAAFLMAVYFRGLDAKETAALTLAMRDSGDVLKFPRDSRPIVDKHSTGGVGDKVSLPLAPLLACLGFRVPMISGRGLGITGGTLDKLDSIPGFQTLLPAKRIVEIVQRVGCVICGQTERMVPADRKMYALRDVTGTVPSIQLITASILSKKLAESLQALILDVKFGSAAFMSTRVEARKLARAMVMLGRQCGVNTRAVLTDMNTPLGNAAGNWLEVKESVACLDGSGPDDLHRLVVECAAQLLVQTRKATSLPAARSRAEDCLRSGAPRQKWDEMLAAQGADLKAVQRKLNRPVTASVVVPLPAPRSGWVTRCDARVIAEVVRDIGGGRLTKESRIDFDVGVDGLVKPGTRVHRGAPLGCVHLANKQEVARTVRRLQSAFEIRSRASKSAPLIVETIL